MRHVREELRLVLRAERELLRLLLQQAARGLDLAVLDLDVAVLALELLRLLLQLLVGGAQLLLLGLKGLRLLLQLLPLGLDCCSGCSVRTLAMIVERTTPIVSVSWSRNCRMISSKARNEAELDHREHLLLEQDRDHDDVARRRLAEADEMWM